MKKLVVIIVIVAVIFVILKIIGVNTSLSLRRSSHKRKGWKSDYKVLMEDNTCEDIIGTSLPGTSSDIHTQAFFYMRSGEKYNWVVASMPKEDFYDLVEELNLKQKPDILEVWPEAFGLQCGHSDPTGFSIYKFWDVRNTVNDNTYYWEAPEEQTRTAFKYENGKLYIRKITKYIGVRDEKGWMHHKKAERSSESKSGNL